MGYSRTIGVLLVLGWLGSVALSDEVQYGSVRNGSFYMSSTLRADDPQVAAMAKAKWKTPADRVFPACWGVNTNTPGGTLEYFLSGGWRGGAFVRLGGGHFGSYFGALVPKKPYVGWVRVRGKGKIVFGLYEYGEQGQLGGATVVERAISTDQWREYQGVYAHDKPHVTSVNLFLAGEGPVDVAEVRFGPADAATAKITEEMAKLYGSGMLIEDPGMQAIQADEAYQTRLADYDAALKRFRANRDKVTTELFAAVESKAAALDPYLRGAGKTLVLASYHNDMMALTRVLREQIGLPPGPVKALSFQAVSSGLGYKPGERAARPHTVTVTDIRSNKVRYNENEAATTVTTIVNETGAAVPITVTAVMRFGLDLERPIAQGKLVLNPGENKWSFAYSVGPETYGRAIEVRCLDGKGELLDRWQEYYPVAAEWFRVQQHVGAAVMKNYKSDAWVTYVNQAHFFAGEPTDFGVHAGDFEEYLSPQAGYHMNMPARKAQIAALKTNGTMCTIYQNCSYSGHMGYEVIRRHPEFALYDPNGQLAVDPIYGGYPNPMELASPIEIGPKRKVTKPYLDRKLTPWGHSMVNTARLDVIEYEANTLKEYSKVLGYNGIYTDGSWGLFGGYGYDGKSNMPSDDVECMRLNARNHRVFSEILKKDDPNFGTWFNWANESIYYFLAQGQKGVLGSGVKGDVGDENIRAAAVRNSMFLMELQDTFTKNDSKWTSPLYHLNMLANNRDLIMQKYGGNMVVGYMFPWADPENPGANRWGWPTLNYFGAQLVATQHHMAGGFVPSMRPWLQFMTRYCRYVWAPDVKVVKQPETLVQVVTPEEVWWKRLVYKLKTDDGYDLIVHLVRIPPTKKWDIEWLDEPAPLANVSVRVLADAGRVRSAWAARPYYFEEPQQVVQTNITPTSEHGQLAVPVPPFRYHTMVVLHVAGK